MAVLVTGGLGRMGHRIVSGLLDHNEDVVILDSLSGQRGQVYYEKNLEWLRNNYSNIKFFKVDLLNKEMLETIVNHVKPSQVYHMAGMIETESMFDQPYRYYEVNVKGTIHLIDVLDQVSCDIYYPLLMANVSQTTPAASSYQGAKQMLESYSQVHNYEFYLFDFDAWVYNHCKKNDSDQALLSQIV